MNLKFLQVNFFKGKYWDDLLDFIKQENADIISMQEVSSGQINFFNDKNIDLFELIKELTGYYGVFHTDVEIVDDPKALFGNAIFSKWPILSSGVIALNIFRPLTLDEFNHDDRVWAEMSRHMLDATIDIGGRKIHGISVHGRRVAPPRDDEENMRQAKLMAEHLKSLGDEPFILGGDFNMPLESEVIKIVSAVSNNLMTNSGVRQTLNPKVHELGEKGYLVDFIFTSKHFKKISLDVPQVTVSDHLPVVAILELD